jgi:4-hydroxy-tetrahydrodipicolinate synthase
MMADLVQAARANDWKKAQGLQVRMNALHRLLFVETSPAPVKAALEAMGRFGPEIRLPLVPMTKPNAAKLKDEMKRLGLL